ncbi:TolB family protein [Streptomyces sp. NPDC087300]|uniref:TolB family protein n=1 Tax=Streptomyces sp. NPDC087300 TaxID=3365780 RepID=UPI0038206922
MRAALSVAVAACAVTAVLPGAAFAGPGGAAGLGGAGVERISVAADGTQGDGSSSDPSITPDGRRVIFSSSATNLTSDTATGNATVFVRDQRTSQTQRMGYLAPVQPPVISGDGEYVAYPVEWIGNVRIRQYQVSTGRTASGNCSLFTCNQPSLSNDGRYTAHNSVSYRQQTYGQRVDVEDWKTGTTQTIAAFTHTQPSRPSISGDGRYVAYQNGQTQDVFVWDRTTGTTTGPIEGPSKDASLVQLSDDGTKAVYLSGNDTYVYDVSAGTAQLVPNVKGVAIDPTGRYLLHTPLDTTGPALALRDLRTATDETVSQQPATATTDAVSTAGRDVVFHSTADDIVPGDTNNTSDVFIRRFY